MRMEYQKSLQVICKQLAELGYRIEQDTSHMAVLENGSCWKIVIEGERYSASTTLFLRHHPVGTTTTEDFAVWLLMEVIETLFGEPHVVPSLVAQLDFLLRHLSAGFPNPSVFRATYERLNEPE